MNKSSILKRIKGSVKVLLGSAKAVPLGKKNKIKPFLYCPVCESDVQEFKRLSDEHFKKQDEVGYIHSIFQMETINRLCYSCPNCGANDRARLYALYFKKTFSPQQKIDLLDFAPNKVLQHLIKRKYPSIKYRSADLYMPDVDDRVDITDMHTYRDNSYDFFICSHVLEHIMEDKKAMHELFRILRVGGKGIVMVPILLSLEKDYEDPTITAANDRWKHFGQDDHVRMYSKPGFLKKLSDVGFKINQLDVNFFSHEVYTKHGIHPRSVLYIVEK